MEKTGLKKLEINKCYNNELLMKDQIQSGISSIYDEENINYKIQDDFFRKSMQQFNTDSINDPYLNYNDSSAPNRFSSTKISRHNDSHYFVPSLKYQKSPLRY